MEAADADHVAKRSGVSGGFRMCVLSKMYDAGKRCESTFLVVPLDAMSKSSGTSSLDCHDLLETSRLEGRSSYRQPMEGLNKVVDCQGRPYQPHLPPPNIDTRIKDSTHR